jgi:RNA recognition motif-containing protein
MNIYVGNLSFNTRDNDLRSAFEQFGTVDSARVVTDRETGRSRGFGFVEMADNNEARDAMNALNGRDFQGRNITANEARPKEDRAPARGRY